MRAIAFSTYGPADVLTPIELPVPEPGPGHVRIRVAAASVNPADWLLRDGRFRRVMRLRLPFVPGSDVAGVVDAVGAGVEGMSRGDAVFAMRATKLGGAYAEYVVIPAAHVAHAPAGWSLGEVASVPLCGLTALQLLRRARLSAGDRLLVHGASGGVGTLAVQIGTALGAEVRAATSERNTELVGGLGAVRVFDYAGDDLGADYDVVLDATNHLPFRHARHLLRPGGTAATVNPFAEKLAPDWLAWTRGGRRLRSLLVQPSGADLTTLATWLASGQVRPVVEQTFPLEEAAQAHRRSETGRVRGKLVLVVDSQLAELTPDGSGQDVARA